MNVVDSSGWLEYFADGPNARVFIPALERLSHLIVPTICLHEVFKKTLRERGEDAAFEAAAQMRRGVVVPLDEALALTAAEMGLRYKVPTADSIILATAQRFDATVWTQDVDFEGIPGVKYWAKKREK